MTHSSCIKIIRTRALLHVVVIVMTRATTGSRLVHQLLHTGHYAAPPKKLFKRKIWIDILVSFFDVASVLLLLQP